MHENPLQELARATEKHLAQNRSTLDWLYAKRFWLVVAILATLFLPVLTNRYAADIALNRSRQIELTGFDILNPSVPVLSNGYIIGRCWCINPFAAAVYLPAAVLGYWVFTGKTIAPKVEFLVTGILCACAVTMPLTHLPVCDVMLSSFWCKWNSQPVLWGWVVLTASSVALFLSTWAQRLPSSNASSTTTTQTGESK
ncbi:MAG: hypothetical protein B9S32_03715 [Verrucomicrobia bacterium Tous-C9LFEB]|nr:MAG: hypothetical protein B9S32_03715 [Verrucomicrobia bacterium Tous-C9LFEB]